MNLRSNPAENISAYDLLVTQPVRQEVARRGLTLLEIDGTQTVDKMIVLVEEHVEPFLKK